MESWFGISSVFWTVVIALGVIVALGGFFALVIWWSSRNLGKAMDIKSNEIQETESERASRNIKRGIEIVKGKDK